VSERDVMRMTNEEVSAFLLEGRRAQVGTSNRDGSIHLVPMSYLLLDGRIALWTDPKSHKIANLRADPRITCLVEAGSEFAEFRAVQVIGRAEVITDYEASCRAGEGLFSRSRDEPLCDQDRAYVATLAHERAVVVVEPTRVVSWDHRKLLGARPDKIGS
jgi:nitroimidazol reductase NimA-like FMN-containing flavoprotein (pyridoxamine 5'-phosphate oxidase superfamily)